MPGPPRTESRWPPAITTRSPSPPGVSAITLWVTRRPDDASTSTRTEAPSRASVSATSTTGMRIPGAASVPLGTPRRVGESSITTSARAPALCAIERLLAEEADAAGHERHVAGDQRRSTPRASQPVPSASQPPVRAAGARVAQHLEVARLAQLSVADAHRGVPEVEVREANRLEPHRPAGLAQALGHVVHRGAVARRARRARAAVPVGYLLERAEVLPELGLGDRARRPGLGRRLTVPARVAAREQGRGE